MTENEHPVVVITGASSGIGKATAQILSAWGWHVIGQGRDRERCASALADIRDHAAPDVRVDMLQCDLSVLSETARLADQILTLTPRIDVLLNNAGGVRDRMEITTEGNEVTFAGNHLGHFLLTKRLLPILRATAADGRAGATRIIATSSLGHELCPGPDWQDIQGITNWSSSKNYCAAKLYNLLFTLELSKREAEAGIIAHAMHPGIVNSNFHSHAEPDMQARMKMRPGDTPDKSAQTLAWLASTAEVGSSTGLYYHDMATLAPSAAALDVAAATRLWTESDALLARSGF